MTPAVLDIIIASILLLSTGFAMYRGIIHEIFSIVGFVAAAGGSYFGGPALLPAFRRWLHVNADGGDAAAAAVSRAAGADPAREAAAVVSGAAKKSELILGLLSPGLAAQIGAYGSVFVVVFIIMSLLSFFLSRGVHEAGLGFVDRLAGAVFGFARGFAFVFLPFAVVFVLAGQNLERFPDWAKNSTSVPLMGRAYAYADNTFGLSKQIEDRGGAIALKFGKINPAAGLPTKEENELKDELSHEEKHKEPEMP
jgi:uncharacterized membrane protein required for colicin V production